MLVACVGLLEERWKEALHLCPVHHNRLDDGRLFESLGDCFVDENILDCDEAPV